MHYSLCGLSQLGNSTFVFPILIVSYATGFFCILHSGLVPFCLSPVNSLYGSIACLAFAIAVVVIGTMCW